MAIIQGGLVYVLVLTDVDVLVRARELMKFTGSKDYIPPEEWSEGYLPALTRFANHACLPHGTTLGVLLRDGEDFQIQYGHMPNRVPDLTGIGSFAMLTRSTTQYGLDFLSREARLYGEQHGGPGVLILSPAPTLQENQILRIEDGYKNATLAALNGTSQNRIKELSELI